MIEYETISVASFLGIVNFYECSFCGAFVKEGSQDKHSQFHRKRDGV